MARTALPAGPALPTEPERRAVIRAAVDADDFVLYPPTRRLRPGLARLRERARALRRMLFGG